MVILCGSQECPMCNSSGYCTSSSIYCQYPEYYPKVTISDHTEMNDNFGYTSNTTGGGINYED